MLTGRHQRGLAYSVLLLAIALLSLAASAALSLGAAMTRRDAETHLLAIGLEFQQALRSYADIPGPAAAPGRRGPRALEDLLKDPRMLGTRRHLRQLYPDPLSGRTDWGLVRDSEGFIVGVHSVVTGKPLQRTGFEPLLANLDGAEDYSQWIFGLPQPAASLPAQR